MKKQIIILAALLIVNFQLLIINSLSAQNIGINTMGNAPNTSAALDIDFSNKGLLIPRVALTGIGDVTTIASTAISLLVYNTATAGTAPNNVIPGYYYWNGFTWISLNGDPVGTIDMYGGATAPFGWLFCDGSAVSRTTYANLFVVIGTSYGSGDGSTTFNLPDARGRAPISAGLGSGLTNRTLGNTGGAETHTLTIAEMPAHTHGAVLTNNSSGLYFTQPAPQPMEIQIGSTSSTGGGGAHNNMQPFWVPNFIIKY